MRDPKRINDFCNKLAQIWHEVPDWRFGQFMINMITKAEYDGDDVFYMEDEELLKMMEKYFKENEDA